MPLFFFLSGYLHKVPKSLNESLKKYWKSIVIPYILFQFIFYPYWLVQHSSEGMDLSNLYESCLLPFAQCLWGIPIDGITWFLVALILMKLYTDICFHQKEPELFIGVTVIFCLIAGYIIWSDNVVNISFAIDSLFNFYPFFIVGYYMRTLNCNPVKMEIRKSSQAFLKATFYLLLSIVIILFIPITNYFMDRVISLLLGAIGSLFIIELCKSMTKIPSVVLTISKGTIILLGLHWMFIGTINFILKKTLHIQGEIYYSTIEAVALVLFITAANYFIIHFCQKHFKALLGGR